MSILTKTAKVVNKAVEIETKISTAILVMKVSYVAGCIIGKGAARAVQKYKKARYQNPHVLDKV